MPTKVIKYNDELTANISTPLVVDFSRSLASNLRSG